MYRIFTNMIVISRSVVLWPFPQRVQAESHLGMQAMLRHVEGHCDAEPRYQYVIEGSLEVKLPTIWTDGKAEVGRVREEKESEERRWGCT